MCQALREGWLTFLKDPASNTKYSQMIQLCRWPTSLLIPINGLHHKDANSDRVLRLSKTTWQSFENGKKKHDLALCIFPHTTDITLEISGDQLLNT